MVGMRLSYSPVDRSFIGFIGAELKAISKTSFVKYDLNGPRNHLFIDMSDLIPDADHFKWICATHFDNTYYKSLKSHFSKDPTSYGHELEYLENPPYRKAQKLKIFLDILERRLLPVLYCLGTERGVRTIVETEKLNFRVDDDLQLYFDSLSSS